MPAPKISVVLPTYNAGTFLRESMDSLMAQTFGDFELLLIDDASTDRTRSIIASYADPRVRLVEGPRQGLTAALNHGLREARGEYVARMDADDISLPTRFAEQTAFMDANPDIAILGAWSENFGTYAGFDTPPAKPDEVKIWLIFSYTMVHASIFLRRNVFIEHGLLYPDGFVQEDYALWCNALTQGLKAANLPKILIRHRSWEEQRTGKHAPDALPKSETAIRRKYLKNAFGIDMEDVDADLLRPMKYWEPETDCESFISRLTALFGKIEEAIIQQDLATRRKARAMLRARFMEWLKFWRGSAQSQYVWHGLRSAASRHIWYGLMSQFYRVNWIKRKLKTWILGRS